MNLSKEIFDVLLQYIPSASSTELDLAVVSLMEKFNIEKKQIIDFSGVKLEIDDKIMLLNPDPVTSGFEYYIPVKFAIVNTVRYFTKTDYNSIHETLSSFQRCFSDSDFTIFLQDFISCIKAKNPLGAVKTFKDKTGAGLRDSKVTVEYLTGVIIYYDLFDADKLYSHLTGHVPFSKIIQKELNL